MLRMPCFSAPMFRTGHSQASKALLQSSLRNQNVPLSSSLCPFLPLPSQISTFSLRQSLYFQWQTPTVRWNDFYRRLSLMENPDMDAASVLNQWETEGKALSQLELRRLVKELRKRKMHEQALKVYDWMNTRTKRIRLSASDAAIQLDLILKVRGISCAEEYFLRLIDELKDAGTYSALLNAYAFAKNKEKAESLLETMRRKGYLAQSLPFNVMMTIYMNLEEYDKVDSLVSEMIKNNMQLDIHTYNIWLWCCGSQGSAEKMEQVVEQMAKDNSIVPHWTMFSTMATMYIKMDLFQKAEECLRKVESRIRGQDKLPYYYLLSCYGRIGKKEEVYRVWNIYKSIFPSIPFEGYKIIISSLIRAGDIEGAKNLYEEWHPVKLSSGPKIRNLLKGYVKVGKRDMDSASVLNQWENEGRNLTKWELCGVVKELMKYKRPERALEVYDWMNKRGERFKLSASDAAIQLDLIAIVHGVSAAEQYFVELTNELKGKGVYGALLNAYVRARMKEKAELLFEVMRRRKYVTGALALNVMMILYMNQKEYDKVDLIVKEMLRKNVKLDRYSYNIWLYCCGSQGSAEKMEQAFEQMAKHKSASPDWSTFCIMAIMYIKMDLFERAELCLGNVESRIIGRDRIPYHCLLSCYGSLGKIEEVYRVWNTYKSIFSSIPNLGYHAVISSLIRMGDIEGAEQLYKEWLCVKLSYDPRIGNLLIGWYVKQGNTDKALDFFKHMIEVGGEPNLSALDALAEGHIGEKCISESLFLFKEASVSEGLKQLKPEPVYVSAFYKLCENMDHMASTVILIGMLRQSEDYKSNIYASLIGLFDGARGDSELSSNIDVADRTDDNDEI